MRKLHISDFLEQAVADILTEKNISFIHESQNNGSTLDFFLPDYNIYVEVKQYHTDRVLTQLREQENVILIQGKKSVEFLKKLL